MLIAIFITTAQAKDYHAKSQVTLIEKKYFFTFFSAFSFIYPLISTKIEPK